MKKIFILAQLCLAVSMLCAQASFTAACERNLVLDSSELHFRTRDDVFPSLVLVEIPVYEKITKKDGDIAMTRLEQWAVIDTLYIADIKPIRARKFLNDKLIREFYLHTRHDFEAYEVEKNAPNAGVDYGVCCTQYRNLKYRGTFPFLVVICEERQPLGYIVFRDKVFQTEERWKKKEGFDWEFLTRFVIWALVAVCAGMLLVLIVYFLVRHFVVNIKEQRNRPKPERYRIRMIVYLFLFIVVLGGMIILDLRLVKYVVFHHPEELIGTAYTSVYQEYLLIAWGAGFIAGLLLRFTADKKAKMGKEE